MGCGSSSQAYGVAWQRNQDVARSLGLNNSRFKRLYNEYSSIIRKYNPNRKRLDYAAFLAQIDIEVSPFARRIFAMCDKDKSGELDLREFIIGMWAVCTLTEHDLLRFAFDMYDMDGSGELRLSELHRVLREVYGNESDKVSQLMAQLKKLEAAKTAGPDEDPVIPLNQFLEFAKRAKSLLFPIFRIQHELTKHVIGTDFWKECAVSRYNNPRNYDAWFRELKRLAATGQKHDFGSTGLVSSHHNTGVNGSAYVMVGGESASHTEGGAEGGAAPAPQDASGGHGRRVVPV